MFVSENDYRRYEKGSVTEVVNGIDTGLNEATSQRLIADVPVGTLCSGGLDSSLITAIAARHSRQITAFNVAIEGYPSIDENRFAKQVTDCLGLDLITFPLTGEVFRRELPHIIHLSDFPLSHPNSVAYYLISQVARRHGVIVLLSGEGADELFGGYTWRYRRLRNLLRLQLLLDRLPEKIREGIGLVGLASIGIYATGIAYRKLLPSTVAFIDRFARQEWQAQCAEAYKFLGNRVESQVLGTMLSDLADFLTPLLRRLDRTSMGASVEARVPFLDHRVVHNAINLPLSYRVGSKGEKWILKQVAARYLPSAIANRKKAGFPLPLQDYLAPVANPAFFENGFCTEVLQLGRAGLAQTVEAWQKNVFGFFSLLALEIWGRQFFMGESAPEISERLARVEKGRSK
jgi:asparagine synthase (glutamine-hydrolysing)